MGKKLSDSQKEDALAMVRHLQTMLAYQQLAMETYNDDAAMAATEVQYGDELTRRGSLSFHQPSLVVQEVIPAVAKKIEIFQLMEMRHREMSSLATASLRKPYEEMAAAIERMLERARLQYDGFQQWVNNPEVYVDTTRLDRDERAAIDRAVKALNELIAKKSGLTQDEWLDIVQESFNSVRASLELMPLGKDVFRSQYMGLISGECPRFFVE
jgi:hypothetical protein